MSKCTDIKDFCGDYSFDVEYSEDNRFTMFFNSLRNAETVKRCIEADNSIPNVATAVDFVEVVRCKNCEFFGKNRPWRDNKLSFSFCDKFHHNIMRENDFCSYGKRKGD